MYSKESYREYKEYVPDKEQERAVEIVRNQAYLEAHRQLIEEGLLEKETQRTKELCDTALYEVEFLHDKDWELLTHIRLYSPELLTHSMETYRLARSKIEHIRVGKETIAQLIEREHVPLETFYRACILHDIGKLDIPEPVLNYALVPGDWFALSNVLKEKVPNERILHYLGLETEQVPEPEHMLRIVTESEISPATMLPVCKLLTNTEQQMLTERGISLDFTLREVLESHEQSSKTILEHEGLLMEAGIAGQHHNYKKEPLHFPISSQTIGVEADLSDLLRLADEEQALRSERAYKPAFSRAKAFTLLAKDAKKGSINEALTALWIQHDFDTIVESATQDDAEYISFLQTFLNTHSSTIEEEKNIG